MNQKNHARAWHPKWLVLIVLVLIGYGLLQPLANSRLGWSLPSMQALLSSQPAGIETADSSASHDSPASRADQRLDSTPQDDNLLHGLLRETRPDDYLSPAGLRYTRGSAEGHRLHHLARHLKDQSDRPGRHGVFQAEMRQVLEWLDDAYNRANAGARGTKKREEDGRTVYEVSFEQPIGYVGGREGRRLGHPETKRLRMVVEGDRVITAFPF